MNAIINHNRLAGLSRKIKKIEKLYGETIGKEAVDSYEFTNSAGAVKTRYNGDDDNINIAMQYIQDMLIKELDTPAEILDIEKMTPIIQE